MAEADRGRWALRVRPRQWQQSALDAWRQGCRGVVSVVTGGGKTLFAEMCMLAFRGQYPGGRFTIIVPTTALLDQWYVSLQEDLGIRDEEVACFSGDDKPEEPRDVNLFVINTAREMAPALAAQTDTCLIVDECHHAGSPVNALALRGRYKAALGLSATPEREYDEGFAEHIAPILGPIIYRYDYRQASRDGVVAPFELVNIRVDLLSDEAEAYGKLSRQIAREVTRVRQGTSSQERLKRILQRRAAVSASAAMRIPVAARLVEEHRGTRTLVFHERVEAAHSIARMLASRGHTVTVYHSRVAPAVRRDNLRLYRRGVFDVLVSCRALDEGMNVPETAVAVMASSTASYRQRIQRLGRVLRPAKGKTAATLYTIYATDQEEQRLLRESRTLGEVASISWRRGVRE